MQSKKRSLIAQFLLSIELLVALVVSSFSWFDRTYTPSVDPFQLSVSSTDGLYIVLEGAELIESSKIDIRTLLGDIDIPTLVQSSSMDGISFTTLDTSTIDSNANDYWDSASFIDAIGAYLTALSQPLPFVAPFTRPKTMSSGERTTAALR